MFGYIVVNKPELKVREFDKYQEYYCGMCRSLGRQCGSLCRLSLSYDLTFLGILLGALYEPDTKQPGAFCAAHLAEKKPYLQNDAIDYAAKMNLVLAYYKCEDDWSDERRLPSLAYRQLIKGKVEKIRLEYPDKCSSIKKCLLRTRQYEKRFLDRKINEKALDAIAGQSGRMMAEVFCWKNDEWRQELGSMGFYMGKFIYLLDAYDDLEDDRKKGRFNPLFSFEGRTDFDEWIYMQLKALASAAAAEFEQLPVIEDAEILRNILYAGIWTGFFSARNRYQKKDKANGRFWRAESERRAGKND